MKTILFQGDSITDGGRSRDSELLCGCSYATLVSARLGSDNPNKYKFINKGISGNRSVDLLARIKPDIISLKPDVLSILIGINDVWHDLSGNGVENDMFEKYYELLIEQVKKAIPDIKIMILEPFVLKGTATEENWEYFRTETEKRAATAQRIAEKYDLTFVPLMDRFDKAAEVAEPSFWLIDGVHPMPAGNEIIAREWIKAFNAL